MATDELVVRNLPEEEVNKAGTERLLPMVYLRSCALQLNLLCHHQSIIPSIQSVWPEHAAV